MEEEYRWWPTLAPLAHSWVADTPHQSRQQPDSSGNPADISALHFARRVQQIAPYAHGHELRGESVDVR